MYLSLNWLKDFVDLPRSLTPEVLGEKLTLHTVEIDDVILERDKYRDVVVGKILDVKKHPNADKLQLVIVDAGQGEQEIVCGATNIKAGNLVPVALVGAVLPNGLEIKAAEIRGVKSRGMLCAEDELGLGEDHSGILILEDRGKIGQTFGDYLNLKDVVYEVDNKSITNRPDLWSHYGLAREIAAITGSKFKEIKTDNKVLSPKKNNANIADEKIKIEVKVEDFKLCPRYSAIAISGIKIEESPQWLQDRLVAIGVRPISNIVDATNYVMMDIGQPLHAFDATLLGHGQNPLHPAGTPPREGNKYKIGVRAAKKGEEIVTLDDEKRVIPEGAIVITNGKEPVAIGGVMGGASTEIREKTKSIIIEAANFEHVSIRQTSQALGLRTEASKRFEKAIDPNLTELALVRVVELIKKICPSATVVSAMVDEKKFSLNQKPIKFTEVWLSKFIGKEIEHKKAIEILSKLGFSVLVKDGEYKVAAPSWRVSKDISIKEDIAEEIVRIYGYNNIELIMPGSAIKIPEQDSERIFIRGLKDCLSGSARLSEFHNYSFVGEEQLKKLGIDTSQYIRLANPISRLQTILRQNLAANLIQNVKTNQARFARVAGYEIGSVFLPMEGDTPKDESNKEKLPYQEKRLAIIIAGDKEGVVVDEVKGVLQILLSRYSLEPAFDKTETYPHWADESQAAQVSAGDKVIGHVNVLSTLVAKKNGIKKAVAIAELSLKEMIRVCATNAAREYTPAPKYPATGRDLAFIVREGVLYNDIRKEILEYHEYIKEVELFDVYRGDKIGVGKKNLAFHISYRADKTLKGGEVDELQKGLVKKLEERFEAKIRDF